jgi:hypothetical protein
MGMYEGLRRLQRTMLQPPVSAHDAHLVRSAVRQIVLEAYRLAEAYNVAAEETASQPKLRLVTEQEKEAP